MQAPFTLKLLSSVFLSSVVISQSASAADAARRMQAVQRAASQAETPQKLQDAYAEALNLPERVKGSALQAIHQKAIGLPMVVPGVNRPANLDIPSFNAIAKNTEFKKLPVVEQNQVLQHLDGAVVRRAPGPIQPAEIHAALGAVVPPLPPA
ncbi:MAG: hypothetical protein K0R52_1639, partial [Alphaproteobacteria bacterium]|nr:hypothetical protein [Alphaproteobacteria bacterium]